MSGLRSEQIRDDDLDGRDLDDAIGIWDPNNTYAVGDVVFWLGSQWFCNTITTAGQKPGVHASWSSAEDSFFRATLSAGITFVAKDTFETITTWQDDIDPWGAMGTQNFTVPITGLWLFKASVLFGNYSTDQNVRVRLRYNGTAKNTERTSTGSTLSTADYQVSTSWIARANIDDTIDIQVYQSQAAGRSISATDTYFYGVLLQGIN